MNSNFIDVDNDNYGYIAFFCEVDSDLFSSFLLDLFDEDKVVTIKNHLINKKITSIFVLKNLWTHKRGNGDGTRALQEIVELSKGLPILAVCDNLESQSEGFSLQKWYVKHGWEVLPFLSLSGPVIIKY